MDFSAFSSPQFISTLLTARSVTAVRALLTTLPIVDEAEYTWSDLDPSSGWKPGRLHWIPVGRDRGNAGRIQLAGDPYNPAAERLINGMEAIIELARRLELESDPEAPMPSSPRDAVERYFGLPKPDLIWRTRDREARRSLEQRMRDVRAKLRLRLDFDRSSREFSMEIRDLGIGQSPEAVHRTLLSLGRTDKADKPYLIGVFGQGGSSTYAASQYSVVLSRRAPGCLDGQADGIGWTIVKKILPRGRRDPYYAALPDGRVPVADLTAALSTQFEAGVMFRHVGYDFGRQGSAVARTLFYALNHVLFNPVLPYDLYALKETPDPMQGTGFRLAKRTAQLHAKGARLLDKSFQPRMVGDSLLRDDRMPRLSHVEDEAFAGAGESEFGSIGIRVVVLPRKIEVESTSGADNILDLAEGEDLPEAGQTPVTSYLERPKGGKFCCVFLVNGQRHDGLDNSFIIQQLGLKYLRNRMFIVVDVDGLRPEALGELMQGSRQSFYKGRAWESIYSGLIATLKGDPDLQKFEEEAEAEVAELQAGDQKVKEALDTLIESHHEHADHVVLGVGAEPGLQVADAVLGSGTTVPDSLVSLLSPSEGEPSDYPVLISFPNRSALQLKPDIEKALLVTSQPSNTWPALTSFAYVLDQKVPELHVAEERTSEAVGFRFKFSPPADFDEDDYPVRTTFRAFARFNGYREPRQLTIELSMRPGEPPREPTLVENPSYLRIRTRQPVRLWLGDADTHVRIQWDGKDDLVLGPLPQWTFKARCLTTGREGLSTSFSHPSNGRFSLLVTLFPDARVGEKLGFEIIATGPEGKRLGVMFEAVVAERATRQPPEPRLVSGPMPTGASRRPPYELKYVQREFWDSGSCFGGENWTPDDAAAYQEPTEKRPLTLLINLDMSVLEGFRKFLVEKKYTETEIQSRLQKYSSHVAFHLYQMFQFHQALVDGAENDLLRPPTPHEQRAEIHRVATTLLKLMQISR